LKKDKKLKYLLKMILAVGNYCNSGSRRLEKAWGFKLNYLINMLSTKTNDPQFKLITLIIDMVE